MSNFFSVILVGIIVGLVNEISLSLGLTVTVWEAPQTVTAIDEGGFLEGLLSFARWAVNNAGSFLQLITFTADIPVIINALLLSPLGLGIFYLSYVMIRGGAG